MTSFSYTDWASKSETEKKNLPGVSIARDHALNNPNRGVYWTPETSAQALSSHIEGLLTHPNEDVRRQSWNEVRGLADDAFRSQRITDRAIHARRDDANRASDGFAGYMDENQLTLLADIQRDVAKIQLEARGLGLDPIDVSRRALNIAAGHAVGFDMSKVENSVARSGISTGHVDNMKGSARQLNNLMSNRDLDAMDMIESIGSTASFDEDSRDEHRRLTDVLGSIPLALDYADIGSERNPSVRMESAAEASVVETLLHQAVRWESLPDRETVHEAFSAWRDAGVAESPFSQDIPQTVGIILGAGPQAAANLEGALEAFRDDPRMGDRDVTILAVDPSPEVYEVLKEHGRPTIDVVALASQNGVYVDARNAGEQKGEDPTIELMTLSIDEANDPIRRSLSANALVSRAATIAYVQGANMSVLEAQAIHVAGTARKLSLGIPRDAEERAERNQRPQMNGAELSKLRALAISIDKKDDPQRYYTAGLARPANGIYGVGFEGARYADRGQAKHAPGKDVMGEAYDRIPKHATIWAVDQKENATVRWMEQNATERTILYAEAKRTLSFATLSDMGLERNKVRTRQAGTEVQIYDRPKSEREYETLPDGREICKTEPLQLNASKDADAAEIAQVTADRAKMRGAIVLVTGHAHDKGTINTSAQEVKVAQETVADQSHVMMIMSDAKHIALSKDVHLAHMVRLAYETNKKATVVNGDGSEIAVDEARKHTRRLGQNRTDAIEQDFDLRMRGVDKAGHKTASSDYAIDSDQGRLALANLPGMNDLKASKLDGIGMTISEVVKNDDPEFHRELHQRGVPSETLRVINDKQAWIPAIERAEAIVAEADKKGMAIYHPDYEMHPLKLVNGPSYEPKSVMIEHTGNPEAFDYSKMKLAAFVGGSLPYNEPGELERREEARIALQDAMKRTEPPVAPEVEPRATGDKTLMSNDTMKERVGEYKESLEAETARIKQREDAIAKYRESLRDTQEMRDPGETVDRKAVRAAIEQFSKNGYGIAVALESGVSKVVLEEAMKVPEAKVVIMAPSAVEAVPVDMRTMVGQLVESGRGAVLMPEAIAQANVKVVDTKPAPQQDRFSYDSEKKQFVNMTPKSASNGLTDAEVQDAGEPKTVPVYFENRDQMRSNLASIASVGVLVASSDRDPALHTIRQMIEQDKPVAAMNPQNATDLHSEQYSANKRLLRDDGMMMIQSEKLAQGVSAQGFAELLEGDTEITLQGGVMRGNSGTFQSSKLAKDDMLRAGHGAHTFEWENAARPISSAASIDRLTAEIDQGIGPVMGRPSVTVSRELADGSFDQVGRVGRTEELRSIARADSVNSEVQEEFSTLSRVHSSDEKQYANARAAHAALSLSR